MPVQDLQPTSIEAGETSEPTVTLGPSAGPARPNWPRNHWYVVALSSEVTTDRLLARTVLGEHLVLFRAQDGTVACLIDRCSHRRYPLSKGTLENGRLVCGYHGFTFECSGACVAVPGQERIPSRAAVRTFPVVEVGTWVFVWMGDPAAPDWERLPRAPWLSDPGWTHVEGMAPLAARFELLVDNLLDLSHETYLHAGLIGTPEVAETPIETEVDEGHKVVRVNRHMQGAQCPAFYARSTGLTSPVDRWQDIEYFPPGFYVLHSRLAPAGSTPRPDGSDPEGFHMKILYGLTPSTPSTTYDFWAVARDFALEDPEVTAALDRIQRDIVQQDVDALELLEQRVAEETDPFEVNIKIDRGGLAARRILAGLIAAERGR